MINSVNVHVHAYSPDIPVSSMYYTLIHISMALEHTNLQSHLIWEELIIIIHCLKSNIQEAQWTILTTQKKNIKQNSHKKIDDIIAVN